MRQGTLVWLLAMFGSGILSGQTRVVPPSALQGAWRIVDVVPTGQTAPTAMSQPSVYLFTGKYFSFVAVSSPTARPNFQDPSNATGDEALAVWGPFMAQAGTYELTGTTLTVRPVVAKNPPAMAGGQTTYSYTLQGDVLTLTVQQNGAGAMGAAVRLARLE